MSGTERNKKKDISNQADGGSVHARPSTQPPIDMSKKKSDHVSAEYPQNISHNL